MGYHNRTCGCADCRKYGQRFNPRAIHNQSCGCDRCGNYGQLGSDADGLRECAPPSLDGRAPALLSPSGADAGHGLRPEAEAKTPDELALDAHALRVQAAQLRRHADALEEQAAVLLADSDGGER